MAGLFGLHPATDGIETAIGQGNGMERVDHLGRGGQHDRIDRGIGGRHVEGTEADPLLPRRRLLVDPARHLDVIAAREDVDDLVVLHVGDRRGEAGVLLRPSLTKEVSSSPMALVWLSRLRSASSRALP